MSFSTPLNTMLAGRRGANFKIGLGPFGSAHRVAVVLDDMSQIPCDAFVLPHFADSAYMGQPNNDVVNGGALSGYRSFESYLSKLQVPMGIGDAYTTKAGGGNSSLLINVACIRFTDGFTEFQRVETATDSAMREADNQMAGRVVFSLLGVDPFGTLCYEIAAHAMLGAMKAFWDLNPHKSPHEIIIAVSKMPSYQALSSVLYKHFADPEAEVERVLPTESLPKNFRRYLVRNFLGRGMKVSSLIASLSHDDMLEYASKALRDLSKKHPGAFDLSDVGSIGKAFEDGRLSFNSAVTILQNIRRTGGSVAKSAAWMLASIGSKHFKDRTEVLQGRAPRTEAEAGKSETPSLSD